MRKYYARRSPPWPFWARNLLDSRSSSKSSSLTSPGVKTLPASNSSFFSLFFRFFGFSSTCCGIVCLPLRSVRIEEIDSPACSVVHDQHRPINHLDIEGVAQFPSKRRTRIRRRSLNRLFDSLVIRDAIDQSGTLSLVKQRPFRPDLGVLLAGHHVDIGSGLLLACFLDCEPSIEPLDPVREFLGASVLEAVQDLFKRPQRAALPIILHDRFHLL